MLSYDAVVLAGGQARRLDGVDKPMTAVAGMPMLARVIDAVSAAETIVVVGPQRQLHQVRNQLRWTQEDPPGGGPVAALAAGMSVLPTPAPLIMVLAADLPFIASAVPLLLDAAVSPDVDGAMLVDDDGRDQPLAAAYRRDALRRRLATLPSAGGAAARDLVRSMRLIRVAGGDAAFDCDTWDDVRRAEERGSGRTRMTLQEWTTMLAQRLGVELDVDLRLVLDLARDAAHNVERPAAPVTTFLVGYAAAKAGGSPQDVAEAASQARALAEEIPRREPA